MFFTRLTFLAAFFIEGLASLVSIIGISSLFGNNLIVMSLMAALDVGKILVVSLLYSYWDKLPRLMKTYALIAATITMIITSAGAAGYLSSAFQQAVLGSQESALRVNTLKEQHVKYQERKKQIDDQIANLSTNTSVAQRLRLMNGFKLEQEQLNGQILDIDKQLPLLQIAQINVDAKASPILFIAKAFDISTERAIKWVILLIVLVFDPLAIFLVIAGNFLYIKHKQVSEEKAIVENKSVDIDLPQPELISENKAEEIQPIAEVITPPEVSTIEELPVVPVKVKKPRVKKVKKSLPPKLELEPIQLSIDEAPADEVISVDAAINIDPPIGVTSAESNDTLSTEDSLPQVENESPKVEDLAKAVWGNIPKTTPREEITKTSLGLAIPRRRTL